MPQSRRVIDQRPSGQTVTGQDMIEGYNQQNMAKQTSQEYGSLIMPSPFKDKSQTKAMGLEKWFPIGSKGRDTSQVRMVAQ